MFSNWHSGQEFVNNILWGLRRAVAIVDSFEYLRRYQVPLGGYYYLYFPAMVNQSKYGAESRHSTQLLEFRRKARVREQSILTLD